MSQIEESLLAVEKELKKVRKGLKKVQKMRAELVGSVAIARHNKSEMVEITISSWEHDSEQITVQKVRTLELNMIETMDPPRLNLFDKRQKDVCPFDHSRFPNPNCHHCS
jgi:PHD/YefM family antitoxin component YafN of YafNO toxin-antitoxin module